LKDAEAVSICVPTPLRKTGDPDLSFIISATEGLAPYVHAGMTVVLESSTYPGTTREMVLPRLTGQNGLKVGEYISLHFSGESGSRSQKIGRLRIPPKLSAVSPMPVQMLRQFGISKLWNR